MLQNTVKTDFFYALGLFRPPEIEPAAINLCIHQYTVYAPNLECSCVNQPNTFHNVCNSVNRETGMNYDDTNTKWPAIITNYADMGLNNLPHRT